MRIGIDARQLSGPMIGTRRALEAILWEWLRAGVNGHEIFLYSPRKFRLNFSFPFHSREGSPVGKVIGGTLWLQTELPFLVGQDDLNVFWGTTDILPLPLARKMPCLLTVQDLGYYTIPDKLSLYVRLMYRWFFSQSLKAAARIVCTTAAVKDGLQKMGYQPEKLLVVRHGVATDWLDASTERMTGCQETHDLRQPYFLFVGHLRPNKNLERMLRAFKQYLADSRIGRPPLLVMAGGRTATDGEIFRLMDDPELKPYVRYIGYVPNEKLAGLYKRASAFVSPSIYEGFGLPYLEAMAVGLPVMASRIPTVMEVCGDAAIYVDPYSETDIARGFAELTAWASQGEHVRRRAKQQASRFSWSHAAGAIMDALEAIGKA